jgi:hypothetical protein
VPTFTELEAVRQNGLTVGVEPNEYELTATFVRDGAADAVVGIDPMGNRLTMPYGTFSKPYRCVALPTNTG